MYIRHNKEIDSRFSKKYQGEGVVNWLIDRLPFELHVPTYRYLGPGTKLHDKLEQNIPGKNPLDEAAKQHDIAYAQSSDLNNRHIADQVLENQAWERVKAKDASFGEKTAAWLVTNTMKLKRKLGAGINRKKIGKKNKNKKRAVRGAGLTFHQLLGKAKKSVKGKKFKPTNLESAVKKTLAAIKKYKVKNQPGRVLTIPKAGGAIPIIPILAALKHVGTILGGIGTVVEGVKQVKAIKDQFKKQNTVSQTSIGSGLTVGPHKKGLGIFLS